MAEELTPRQRQVLELFVEAARHYDPAPTYREICDALGCTGLKTAVDKVAALVKKGWLERGTKGASRSLRLTGWTRAVYGLPPSRKRAA